MYIKLVFLTNVIFAFASNISWASNHRLDELNEKLLPSEKNNSHRMTIKNNEQLLVHKGRFDNIKSANNGARVQNAGTIKPSDVSEETHRIQFQMEGHKGPQTYIFGFDTGHGKNRQYRMEERHHDGTVRGQYGYYDAKGKLRTIQYVAKPFEGYTEIHHESDIPFSKN